jgi:Methyltransferase domain
MTFLHFGCGPNLLPEPWQNLDPSHDIRKRLRFESGSVRAVFAEHVIEHVPYLQALGFFSEALRVLEPGGVLRVAFPDIGRLICCDVDSYKFTRNAATYAELLKLRPAMTILEIGPTEHLIHRALLQLLRGWGHQMAWTEDSAAGALLVSGFSEVKIREYGQGALSGIDGHHLDVGGELAKLESTILEATK